MFQLWIQSSSSFHFSILNFDQFFNYVASYLVHSTSLFFIFINFSIMDPMIIEFIPFLTKGTVVWQGIETPFFPFFKIYLYFNGFLPKNEKWRHFTLFSKKSYIRGFFPYFSLMSFFSPFCHFHSKNKLNFKYIF